MGQRSRDRAHFSSAALAGLLLSSVAMIFSIAAFSICEDSPSAINRQHTDSPQTTQGARRGTDSAEPKGTPAGWPPPLCS